jgi:hypothetical protein
MRLLQQKLGDGGSGSLLELEDLAQIAVLQDTLNEETNVMQWFNCAKRLQKIYQDKGLFPESYEVCEQIFLRVGTVTNGLEVVNICLAFHETERALSFVESLELKFSEDHNAFVAIEIVKCNVFLAMGEAESARELVRKIPADSVKTPELLLQLAKIQAATRQHASSVKSLTRCFESTPPSVLPMIKAEVWSSSEFKSISYSRQFKEAMTTSSKRSEICCPNGSSKEIRNTGTMSLM